MSRHAGLGMVASLLLLNTCVSDQPGPEPGLGELGKGSLSVTCTEQDATCTPDAATLAQNVPIAVGASFAMAYVGQIPKAPTGKPTMMTLFSASPSMLSREGDHFIAWMPGRVAVLARTQEGTVTDFVHLALASVESIEIERDPMDGSSSFSVGEEGTWLATPRSVEGVALGGNVSYTWEVEGGAVALQSQDGRSVTLVALEVGTATLRAHTGDTVGETTIDTEPTR